MNTRLLATAALLLTGLFATPRPAHAAESYDNCVGTISSLPATISTQGVWCLKKDLATAIASGNAIEITANNVTIDCNDFKLGGLAAGEGSEATGIHAATALNTTIRHCGIRGFFIGIDLQGTGGGHLVEDNRVELSRRIGIRVLGDNTLVRRNRVFDTGGAPASTVSDGIIAEGDVVDNIVSGVFANAGVTGVSGIALLGTGNGAIDNLVRNLVLGDVGSAVTGIAAEGDLQTVRGNRVIGGHFTAAAGMGIAGGGVWNTVCSGNVVVHFENDLWSCTDGGGNFSF